MRYQVYIEIMSAIATPAVFPIYASAAFCINVLSNGGLRPATD